MNEGFEKQAKENRRKQLKFLHTTLIYTHASLSSFFVRLNYSLSINHYFRAVKFLIREQLLWTPTLDSRALICSYLIRDSSRRSRDSEARISGAFSNREHGLFHPRPFFGKWTSGARLLAWTPPPMC